MTQTCENCKANPVEIARKTPGTPTAKLIAVLIAQGITDTKQLAEILGVGVRAVQLAKQVSQRSTLREADFAEAKHTSPNEAGFAKQASPLARANKELPSEVSSIQEVKNISSVPSETEHTPKPPKPKFARRRFSYTREFEEFWGSYPSIGNSSKSKAFESWRHLLPAEQLLAADGLLHLTAYCRANPKYTCMHVTTYLNERRWEAYETPAQRMAAKPQKPAEPEWMKRQRLEAEVLAINGMAA